MTDYEQFGKDYFRNRIGNDPVRLLSFLREKRYLVRFMGSEVFEKGKILDVGCSTGEFIEAIGWNRTGAYGMEISDFARTLAQDKGIRFDKTLFNTRDYFDVVVFRGTIQYLPNPFDCISGAFSCLKPGGHIVFLATPNSNSPYYLLFRTLPFLEEGLNYLIPNDVSLSMNLRNCGFEIVNVEYPYLRSPYAHPIRDHLKFVAKLICRTRDRFPFWRSMMSVVARKPGDR